MTTPEKLMLPPISPEEEKEAENKDSKVSRRKKLIASGVAAVAVTAGAFGLGKFAGGGENHHETAPNTPVAEAPAVPGNHETTTPNHEIAEDLTLANFPYQMEVSGKTFRGIDDLNSKFSLDTDKYTTDEEIGKGLIEKINLLTQFPTKNAEKFKNVKHFDPNRNQNYEGAEAVVGKFIDPAFKSVLTSGENEYIDDFVEKISKRAHEAAASGIEARAMEVDQVTDLSGDLPPQHGVVEKTLMLTTLIPRKSDIEDDLYEKWQITFVNEPTDQEGQQAWKVGAYLDKTGQ